MSQSQSSNVRAFSNGQQLLNALRWPIPVDVAQQLGDYASTWDLSLTEARQDLRVERDDRDPREFRIVIRRDAFLRIAEKTGHYRPGRIEIDRDPNGAIRGATATAWRGTQEGQWTEVSVYLAWFDWMERDLASDVARPTVLSGSLSALSVELRLQYAGEVQAARKALSFVAASEAHQTDYDTPPVLLHQRYVASRLREQVAKDELHGSGH